MAARMGVKAPSKYQVTDRDRATGWCTEWPVISFISEVVTLKEMSFTGELHRSAKRIFADEPDYARIMDAITPLLQ